MRCKISLLKGHSGVDKRESLGAFYDTKPVGPSIFHYSTPEEFFCAKEIKNDC